MAQAVPGIMALFSKTVPEEMWATKEFTGVAADRVAVVACPCGEEPEVAQLLSTICKCGRAFILAGERVLVATERVPERDDEG